MLGLSIVLLCLLSIQNLVRFADCSKHRISKKNDPLFIILYSMLFLFRCMGLLQQSELPDTYCTERVRQTDEHCDWCSEGGEDNCSYEWRGNTDTWEGCLYGNHNQPYQG